MSYFPCFCITLQSCCKIVAVLQIIWGSCLLLVSTFLLIGLMVMTSLVMSDDELPEFFGGTAISEISVSALFSGVLVVGTLTIICACLLWTGARDRKSGRIRVWLYVNGVFLAIFGLKHFYDMWLLKKIQETDWILLGAVLSMFLLHTYFILVVFLFTRELRKEAEDSKVNSVKQLEIEGCRL